jgi:Zn finger protein HypA/HybF involved in hydrogenase expression
MGISLGISFAISIILPFPISLVVIMGVFILLSMYMRKIMMKRMRGGKGLGIFNPGIGSGKLKYYCMACGEQHNQLACPKCGSKMKRVGT